MRTLLLATALTVAIAAAPSLLSAQAEPALKQERPGLLAQATVSYDSAKAVARRAVPGGVIREAELENEHDRLVFSFDIQVAGKSGIEEIQVDARTGRVVAREHENPAAVRAESRHDAEEADTGLKQETPGLLAQATVPLDSAKAIALRAVPGGRIKESELEHEHDVLVYSFDIKVAGKRGVEEIQVDARTGRVVAHEHENEAAEHAEEQGEHRDSTHHRRP